MKYTCFKTEKRVSKKKDESMKDNMEIDLSGKKGR